MRALATGGLSLVDVELISDTWRFASPVGAARRECRVQPSDRVTEALLVEEAAGLHEVDGYLDCGAGPR